MRKAPLAVFAGVLLVFAVVALSYLTSSREAITSTPSAYTGLTVPLPVPARGEACADEILYDTDSGVARFGATAIGADAAPALEVVARGNADGPYRSGYRSVARLEGGWHGTRQLDVRLRPPHTAVFGMFCVRNLGDKPISLVGSDDGRAYARPTVRVNGKVTGVELQLRLLEARRSSILSRLGEVTTHAATLKPFGAWWMWVLAIALIGLAPLGVLASIRAALVSDGERERAPVLAWPAWVARARELPGWALAGGAGAIAVLWLFYWSVNTHVFQNDEDQYVYLSRWLLHNLPGGLWDFNTYGRGLQRLEVFLLALPTAVVHNPWSLGIGRLLNVAAFVSTAIPVYLLGRGMGLSSRWAVLPALLSGVVPWAVVTTAFLTENLAYPAFAWIVYGIWRATVRPGTGNDVLAIALIFIGGLSRSALIALAPVLPATIVLSGLRCGTGGIGARIRVVLRAHVLLWAGIVVLGLLLIAGIGPFGGLASRLAGGYGTRYSVDLWPLVEKSGRFFARVVIGTGYLPAAIGLPWLAIKLVRSREPAFFAFALTAVLSALVLFYTLNTAGFDERYVVYLAPLVLLPAGLALGRREISPLGTAIASVALALLILRVPWNGNQGSFAYFVWPVETFYTHVLGFKLAEFLPGGEQTALNLVAIALGALGVALAAGLRWRPARLSGGIAMVLVAAVAVTIVGETQYSLSKHVSGVGSKSGPNLKARAFADVNAPAGAAVGEWAVGVGERPDFEGVWREVQFYNQRVDRVMSLGGTTVIVPPGDDFFNGIAYDENTGRLTSPKPLPPYMVVPTQADGPHLRGEVVTAPTYIPVALMRLSQPPSIAWRASGFALDGSVTDPKKGATIRVYGGGARCVNVDMLGPPELQSSFTLVGRDVARFGRIQPAGQATVALALPGLRARGHEDIAVSGDSKLLNVRLDDRC